MENNVLKIESFYIKPHLNLDPYFITGLTEAEGSFSIIKIKDKRAKYDTNVHLRFKITMLTNETELLTMVKSFFKCGTNVIGKNGTISFEVKDINSLNKYIIPHFSNYPLRGTKYLDFLTFKETLDVIISKEHLTKEGLNKIIDMSFNMNSYRKLPKEYCPVHTIEKNPLYIPINGHYINGFIAGDGCLALNTKDNAFGRMSLQISQHRDNKILLYSIANYFKSPTKIYYHDTNSVQLTLSGIKLWETIIFDHFIEYPLYGSKTIRLNKLFKIREVILKKEYLIKKGKGRIWDPKIKLQIIDIWLSSGMIKHDCIQSYKNNFKYEK